MIGLKLITLCGLVALATSQDYQEYRPAPHRLAAPEAAKPTPVPILKQINRHNEDGSYTYGYEGADGSFKIETKLATGEVKGKYGYVDADGKVRVVEYGANKYGFQPAGEGITVAPPTLVDETTNKDGTVNADYEDGSYYQVTAAPKPQVARVSRPQPRPVPQVVPQFQEYEQYEQPQVAQYRPVASRPQGVPSGVVYAPQTRPPRPEPVEYSIPSGRAQPHYTSVVESAPVRSAPPQTLFRAQPQPQHTYSVRPEPQIPQQIQYAPQPAQVRPSQGGRQLGAGRGVLDQLAKDYALPAGGSPALHDISFGYY